MIRQHILSQIVGVGSGEREFEKLSEEYDIDGRKMIFVMLSGFHSKRKSALTVSDLLICDLRLLEKEEVFCKKLSDKLLV